MNASRKNKSKLFKVSSSRKLNLKDLWVALEIQSLLQLKCKLCLHDFQKKMKFWDRFKMEDVYVNTCFTPEHHFATFNSSRGCQLSLSTCQIVNNSKCVCIENQFVRVSMSKTRIVTLQPFSSSLSI